MSRTIRTCDDAPQQHQNDYSTDDGDRDGDLQVRLVPSLDTQFSIFHTHSTAFSTHLCRIEQATLLTLSALAGAGVTARRAVDNIAGEDDAAVGVLWVLAGDAAGRVGVIGARLGEVHAGAEGLALFCSG